MFFSTLLLSLADLLNMVITLYIWILIAGVVVSWLNVSPYNNFVQVIHRLCEPGYRIVKKIIPKTVFNGIDFSPMILILSLSWFNIFIVRFIANVS